VKDAGGDGRIRFPLSCYCLWDLSQFDLGLEGKQLLTT